MNAPLIAKSTQEPAGSGGMSRARLIMVHAMLAFLAAGSLCAFVLHREYWPFSPYAMFSEIYGESLSRTRVFGVTAFGRREIPLTEPETIRPFDQLRLDAALSHLQPPTIRAALLDILNRYEQMRIAGLHHGPALARIKLYVVTWRLDPLARNKNHPIKDLICETGYLEPGK